MQTLQTQLVSTENQAISLSKVVVTPDHILVASDDACTLWIDEMPAHKHVTVSLEQNSVAIGKNLLARCTVISRQAKERGVKLQRGVGVRKQIKALVPLLDTALADAKNLYAQLQTRWESKCKKGIYRGYCDDVELNHLGQLKGQYMALYYHSAALGQLIDIEHHLNQVELAVQSKSIVSVSF
jgi:hypothetical protein